MRVAVAFRDEFTSVYPGSEAKFIAVGNTPEDLLPVLVRRVGIWPAGDMRIGVYETDKPGELLECYGLDYDNDGKKYVLRSLNRSQTPEQEERPAGASSQEQSHRGFLAELNRQG
jgi:hypothetical protein